MATCNFLLEIDFKLNPLKEQEFGQCLEILTEWKAAGHVQTLVYEDLRTPGHLLWVSEWLELPQLEGYLASGTFRALVGGLKTLGSVEDFRVLDLRPGSSEIRNRFALRSDLSGQARSGRT